MEGLFVLSDISWLSHACAKQPVIINLSFLFNKILRVRCLANRTVSCLGHVQKHLVQLLHSTHGEMLAEEMPAVLGSIDPSFPYRAPVQGFCNLVHARKVDISFLLKPVLECDIVIVVVVLSIDGWRNLWIHHLRVGPLERVVPKPLRARIRPQVWVDIRRWS